MRGRGSEERKKGGEGKKKNKKGRDEEGGGGRRQVRERRRGARGRGEAPSSPSRSRPPDPPPPPAAAAAFSAAAREGPATAGAGAAAAVRGRGRRRRGCAGCPAVGRNRRGRRLGARQRRAGPAPGGRVRGCARGRRFPLGASAAPQTGGAPALPLPGARLAADRHRRRPSRGRARSLRDRGSERAEGRVAGRVRKGGKGKRLRGKTNSHSPPGACAAGTGALRRRRRPFPRCSPAAGQSARPPQRRAEGKWAGRACPGNGAACAGRGR